MGLLTQTESFQRELLKLTREDQERVYDALLKYVQNPATPGLQVKPMQRVDLWEIRASRELRIIAQRDGDDLFCYSVGHHDAALKRAERLRAAELAELDDVRRRASAIVAQPDADGAIDQRDGPLAAFDDAELELRFGIPIEWIPTVRRLESQDQVLGTGIDAEIGEDAFWRFIELFASPARESTGAKPVYRVSSAAIARAFVAGEVEELEFNLPASSWAIVQNSRRAPMLVKGGPGSGKTLVALYRALHVLEEPSLNLSGPPRVLYVTYTQQLRDDAREKFRRLRGAVPEGLRIETFDAIAQRLNPGGRTIFDRAECMPYLKGAIGAEALDADFVIDEITAVIQRRNVRSGADYAALQRKGRGARLSAADRTRIWGVYERYRAALAAKSLRDLGMMRMDAADRAMELTDEERNDFVIVDEVQDLSWPTLAMVTALARGQGRSKHLMLVGDAGQAIYQTGFKWAEVGLRIGGGNVFGLGRSERNTDEVLAFARALIGKDSDQDDAGESCSKRGPRPRVVRGMQSTDQRRAWLAADIAARIASGISPRQIAIVAHGKNELRAIDGELEDVGVSSVEHKSEAFYRANAVKLITAHSAKGLEFPEVYVPDANDGTYPFYKNADLPQDEREERDAQDCKLLYVACTRAGQRLTVVCDRHPSPFLNDALAFADVVDAGVFESA